MGRFLASIVSVLSLQRMIVGLAQADLVQDKVAQGDLQTPSHAVSVSASFPDAAIFGIKLINGKTTQAMLSVSNDDPDPITVNVVGGALWSLPTSTKGSHIVRNLTATRYKVKIPAGEKQSLPFNFVTDLHPQDLRLELATVMTAGSGSDTKDFAVVSFNETVSVVDPDTSILDPRVIFLYIFMLVCAVTVIYFFYTIWIAPYFPQQKRNKGTAPSDRAKKSTTPGSSRETGPTKATGMGGGTGDGSAVTTGSRAYNEEWIPAHHIQRPEAKRVKSAPRPKSKGREDKMGL